MIDDLINSDLLVTDNRVNLQVSPIIDRNVRFYSKVRWSSIYWLSNNGQSYELRSFQCRIIHRKFLGVLACIILLALLIIGLSIYLCLNNSKSIRLLAVVSDLLLLKYLEYFVLPMSREKLKGKTKLLASSLNRERRRKN